MIRSLFNQDPNSLKSLLQIEMKRCWSPAGSCTLYACPSPETGSRTQRDTLRLSGLQSETTKVLRVSEISHWLMFRSRQLSRTSGSEVGDFTISLLKQVFILTQVGLNSVNQFLKLYSFFSLNSPIQTYMHLVQ